MSCDIDGIGARGLVNADRRGRRAVEPGIPLLGLCAEIDARDVLDAHDRAVGIGTYDDVLELVGPGQPALGCDCQLKLLILRRGRGADAAQRGLDVLALHRRNDVGRGQAEGSQPIGVEPQAQRVIERAKQARLPDAADARQRIDDVDRRIVVEEQRVMRVLWRIDRDDL
jgi:ATP phosphoribosyltransferase regulatory subunit HisZ